MEGKPFNQAQIQDWTIAKMRDEIKKGPDWLCRFHWALRYTDSVNDPVITADHPFAIIGSSSNVEIAIKDPDTLIYFPICWQAFLFGSIRRFDVETERFDPDTLKRVRAAYIENGHHFLVSPLKLDQMALQLTAAG